MGDIEGKAQKLTRQPKQNMPAFKFTIQGQYCSAAAQLWSNLNSESILGGNFLFASWCFKGCSARFCPHSWAGTFSPSLYWSTIPPDWVSRYFWSLTYKGSFITHKFSQNASYKPVYSGSVQKEVVGFSLHFFRT